MTSDLRGLAAALGIVGLALLACKGLRSEKGDTNPPATTAPTASEAPKKEAVVDVTRYPDEQAASGTARPNGDAVARQAATPSAKSVGNVKAGDELGLVAAHEGFVLVSVTDDGVAGQLGWVPRSAFGDLPGIEAKPIATATAAFRAKYVSCPAGQAAAGTKDECLVVCTDTAPCADGMLCLQSSFVSGSNAVKNVRVCLPAVGGRGTQLRPVLKGAPWLNDAIPQSTAAAAVPPASVGAASDFAKPGNPYSCPAGFADDVTGNGTRCARICTSTANCHAPNTCVSLNGITKVCDGP